MYGSDWHPEIETDSNVGPTGEYWQWIVARGCCHDDCTGIQASYDDDVRDLCTGCTQCHDAVEIEESIEEGSLSPGDADDNGEVDDDDGQGDDNGGAEDHSGSLTYFSSRSSLQPMLSGCLLFSTVFEKTVKLVGVYLRVGCPLTLSVLVLVLTSRRKQGTCARRSSSFPPFTDERKHLLSI